MKKHLLNIAGLTLLAAALAITGCSRQEPAGDGHDHAGHSHAAKSQTSPTQAAAGPACAAHSAPKELCFICDPTLREKGRLWCKEHNRYEDRCWLCHPELRDKNRLYCDEHGMYEDECFICHPELGKKPAAQAPAGAPKTSAATLMCEEHGVPEGECGICHPELAAQLKPGQSILVRLPSAESAESAGVRTARPALGTADEAVESYAELMFDQNKLAQVVAPVAGILQEVSVDLGARVQEQQVVARIWSAAIAESVAKAVLSHQVLDRERKLRAQRVTSQQQLQEAEASHRAACQQLRMLGFSEEQVEVLGLKPQDSVMLEVRAPFAGEIVGRTAVKGSLIEAGKPLFTVADRSVMWAMLQIPESAISRVSPGQAVELRLDSLPERTFTGRLTWVDAEIDQHSRMTRARAEIENPEGLLKARMFAGARILTRPARQALLLPAESVQVLDGRQFVFVRRATDLFEVRAIQAGARTAGGQEIVAGLKPEDEVAVERVFPLKSQLLASKLGAGCAHE